MATTRTDRAFNKKLARQVSPATRATAEVVAGRARANLAGHRDTGASSIRVEHGRVDSYVILDDEASLSIEFGHGPYVRSDGSIASAMEGLHILGRAVRGA